MALYVNGKKVVNSLVVDGIDTSVGSAIRTEAVTYPSYIPIRYNSGYVPIDYNKDWTIKVRMKVYSFSGNCAIIGTAKLGTYYANPSAELSSNRESIWWSISQDGSSWSYSQNFGFSETLALNTWYDIKFQFIKTTNKQYCEIKKVSDGTIIGSKTTTISGTIYQPTQSTYPESFGNVAYASNFTKLDNQSYDFANSYIENDGVILWGHKSISE